MSKIIVNVCPPEAVLGEPWADLVRRAPENVFMNPVALRVDPDSLRPESREA